MSAFAEVTPENRAACCFNHGVNEVFYIYSTCWCDIVHRQRGVCSCWSRSSSRIGQRTPRQCWYTLDSSVSKICQNNTDFVPQHYFGMSDYSDSRMCSSSNGQLHWMSCWYGR